MISRGVLSGVELQLGQDAVDDGAHDVVGDGLAQVLAVAEVAVEDGAADAGGLGDLLGAGAGAVPVDGGDAGRDEAGAALGPVLGPAQAAAVRRAGCVLRELVAHPPHPVSSSSSVLVVVALATLVGAEDLGETPCHTFPAELRLL